MKRHLWEIQKKLGRFFKIVTARFASFYFPLTISALKSARYKELPAPIDWQKIARNREIHVEIGSGHGEVLLANDPEKSIVVGYEIKSRFFRLSERKTKKRADIFIYQGSGYESLLLHYKNDSVSSLFILFPDPWHKKKHNRRRPLVESFFRNAAQKLQKHGRIVIATDWPDYAAFITEQVHFVEDIYDVVVKPYNPDDFSLPVTHFHQKWVRKGRSFTAFVLSKRV